VGARTPGHGIARASPQPDGDAAARAHADPHAHPAAYEPFAYAVADQPVTVPDAVWAGPLAVGGVAHGERAGLRGAIGNDGPAVGPVDDQPEVAIAAAVVAARTAAFISSIALRTAPDAQLPWAISSARAASCRLDRP
jgi:hypothetical protein